MYESGRVCASLCLFDDVCMRYSAIFFFGHSVFMSARSLNAFHYKTSMRISHRQHEQRAHKFVCCTFDIFVCSASGKSHCPNAYIHYTLQHSLAAVSTASTAVAVYKCTHTHTHTTIQVKPFWIYTYTYTIYTLFVVQPSMKYIYTHTRIPEKNTV